jgi:hypothetical protein
MFILQYTYRDSRGGREMNAFPTESDINNALELLLDYYKVPETTIKGLFGEENYTRLNNVLTSLGKNEVSPRMLARMLVIEKGAYLFSGSNNEVRALREHLLRQLSEKELTELYQRNPDNKRSIKSPSYMVRPLVHKKWVVGGSWPRDFVTTLGFPLIFQVFLFQKTIRRKRLWM